MNISQGPHYIDDTLTFSVTTHDAATGALTDADAVVLDVALSQLPGLAGSALTDDAARALQRYVGGGTFVYTRTAKAAGCCLAPALRDVPKPETWHSKSGSR